LNNIVGKTIVIVYHQNHIYTLTLN